MKSVILIWILNFITPDSNYYDSNSYYNTEINGYDYIGDSFEPFNYSKQWERCIELVENHLSQPRDPILYNILGEVVLYKLQEA